MEEDYRRLEESYRRLEEQCRFYEGRCKALEGENKALKEKCDAYEGEKRETSERNSKSAKRGWEKRRKKASDAVSPSDPCSLSDSARNVPVAPSKCETMDIDGQRPKAVVAWQREEERREEVSARLYKVETVSFQKPTVEQVYEYMHTYTMGAWYIDAKDEARQFMDFYEARGWIMGQTPMRDWRAAARDWINMRVNKIKYGNNRQKQADYENDRGYYGAIRSIEEDARYRREHGEEELHY